MRVILGFHIYGPASFQNSPKPHTDLSMKIRFNEKRVYAIERYHNKYGDCNIPTCFRIPKDTYWPRCTFNLKLHRIADFIRTQKRLGTLDPTVESRMNNIGFIWNTSDHRTQAIMTAFETYKQHYGNFHKLTKGFNVPRNATLWPEITHRLPLGRVLHTMRRYNGTYLHLRPFLTALGVDLRHAIFRENYYAILKDSVQLYREIYAIPEKDRIALKVKIPGTDERFHKLVRGGKIGQLANYIKHVEGYNYKHHMLRKWRRQPFMLKKHLMFLLGKKRY